MSVCDNFQVLLLFFKFLMSLDITGFLMCLSKLSKWNMVLM
jgi:hypothetical protein